MFDWQIIAAGFALLSALIYVGWRGWLRISSLKPQKKMAASSCGAGCGCSISKPLRDNPLPIIAKRKLHQS